MKVLIIGGGASGMMAALVAAQDAGNRVTLLERQARVGRKLLASGNGRCNLSNLSAWKKSSVFRTGKRASAGFTNAAAP